LFFFNSLLFPPSFVFKLLVGNLIVKDFQSLVVGLLGLNMQEVVMLKPTPTTLMMQPNGKPLT
jgi:hypothetical protein